MELMEGMVKKGLKENVVIRVNEGLQVKIIGKHTKMFYYLIIYAYLILVILLNIEIIFR